MPINADQCRSMPINAGSILLDLALIDIDRHWEEVIRSDQNWSTLIGIDRHWDQCQNFDRHWLALIGIGYWSRESCGIIIFTFISKWQKNRETFSLTKDWLLDNQWRQISSCRWVIKQDFFWLDRQTFIVGSSKHLQQNVSFSSDPSLQSSSPSHLKLAGTQRLLSHSNWSGPHVGYAAIYKM